MKFFEIFFQSVEAVLRVFMKRLPGAMPTILFGVPDESILADKQELAMSVKASISITDQQDEFARKLVAEGHYDSLSDVVQHGLDLVRQETEWSEDDRAALSTLLNERLDGDFISMEESDRQIDEMIEANRKAYGL